MSRTLSVLIVENFVITEGPKWDKFKSGAKKVGRGAVTAATIGAVALAGKGGHKLYDANKNYDTEMKTNIQYANNRRYELNKNMRDDLDDIDNYENLTYEVKEILKDQTYKNFDRDWDTVSDQNIENRRTQITDKRDKGQTKGKKALAGAAGLGVAPLLAGVHDAGAKSKRKKQENKSLKERLNLVKSGMFLNEESDDITALRNKINQGLIILPGLKGSAADKMEDAIRSWEDQINKLKNKIGEKYE